MMLLQTKLCCLGISSCKSFSYLFLVSSKQFIGEVLWHLNVKTGETMSQFVWKRQKIYFVKLQIENQFLYLMLLIGNLRQTFKRDDCKFQGKVTICWLNQILSTNFRGLKVEQQFFHFRIQARNFSNYLLDWEDILFVFIIVLKLLNGRSQIIAVNI